MTVREFLEDCYEELGEEDQLSPYDAGGGFDIGSAGSVRMLKWLNRAYQVVTNFKLKDGTLVRFPKSEGELFFKTSVITGTVTAAASTTVTLDGSAPGYADALNGWLVEITGGTGEGQVRLIVDYDLTRSATVHDAWDTTPDATSTYALYKRFMRIVNAADADAAYGILTPSQDAIRDILKIVDLDLLKEVPYGGRIESFAGSLLIASRPSAWYQYADMIVFDVAVSEEMWFKLEFEREFAPLSLETDEPRIPEEWQEAMLLWLVWRAKRWAQEPGAAYGAKRDFYDFVHSLKIPGERAMDRDDGRTEVEL